VRKKNGTLPGEGEGFPPSGSKDEEKRAGDRRPKAHSTFGVPGSNNNAGFTGKDRPGGGQLSCWNNTLGNFTGSTQTRRPLKNLGSCGKGRGGEGRLRSESRVVQSPLGLVVKGGRKFRRGGTKNTARRDRISPLASNGSTIVWTKVTKQKRLGSLEEGGINWVFNETLRRVFFRGEEKRGAGSIGVGQEIRRKKNRFGADGGGEYWPCDKFRQKGQRIQERYAWVRNICPGRRYRHFVDLGRGEQGVPIVYGGKCECLPCEQGVGGEISFTRVVNVAFLPLNEPGREFKEGRGNWGKRFGKTEPGAWGDRPGWTSGKEERLDAETQRSP